MRLLWALLNTLQALFIAAWTAGGIVVALTASLLARSPRPGLALARIVWAPSILGIIGARLRVEGSERLRSGGPYFIVANHQSWVDIPSLFLSLPLPVLFLAKKELVHVPFLGRYMSAMGMVFIDRVARQDSARSIGEASERLRQGWSVLSFPEGTRSPDGRVQRFKTATFAAAIATGVPVVPVAMAGPERILPARSYNARPGRVRVAVGEPILTAGLDRSERAALADRAQREVEALLARIREAK
jgi:1-acyl-sn-glycerol-3-phosphate acyltransferase